MRLSHVLVAIASVVLISNSTATDSKQVKISSPDLVQSIDVIHGSKRLLRSDDDEYYFDNGDSEALEEEERGVNLKPLTEAKMWTMKGDGMSAKAYAKKMGIYDTMKEIERTGKGWTAFQGTHRFQKYIKYFNFLKENK
ncbi:hypothetical protein PHYBOEH_008696 [Phytophthora boehmeriae]|uniref:PexRD2 WYL domain-containing protein n=1 Tax=Phytophthora boehmeriae TaxID=109152 RepID=A0A8T1W1K6_9STRA|nr:hypothetical protein PHYBOEH_008696 [Phytophthora boehmeriae]